MKEYRGSPRGPSLERLPLLALTAAFILSTGLAAWPQQTGDQILTERKVMIPMRDGVKLAANIFRPDAPGRFPVVLLRTCYGRTEMQPVAIALAKRGYACVWQDVRGRFDSEGEWLPFFNEARDGYDTIQWAAEQPWSDGDVVMVGGSYSAMVQWLAAKEHNPHLKGLVAALTPGDFYADFFYEGGAFALGAGALWSVLVDGKQTNFSDTLKYPWDKVFAHLPVEGAIPIGGRDPQFFKDWLAHPSNDDYWHRLSWDKEFEKFDFPVVHVGGWYDIFQKGTIENFIRMKTRAETAARGRQRLIVGPWAHQGQDNAKVGDVNFGPESKLDLRTAFSDWVEYCLKGTNTGNKLAPVRVFTMGENKWREYETWPVSGALNTSYYFHSGGRANSAAGDGRLVTASPRAADPPDHYTYDPNNPAPTRGGGNCCWPQIIAWGPLDQREIERRQDVLVYSTPPLTKDVGVTGPVEIKLWITTSAPDTDFTGKLVDVAPDGMAMNLTDGIQRLAYRRSFKKPELVKPGTPVELTVDLWNTSHVFLRGHRIRVEISSSNFPRYSRNFNTGSQPETETRVEKATQTIFHDRRRASRIVLPVLP
jgi:putative CocE/NonD family hydrolase